MLGWELPPYNSGGLGVACVNLARQLVNDGAKVDFVVPYSAKHEKISFMNVVSATNLEPSSRYGVGAYDSIYVKDPSPQQKPVEKRVTIREIQHDYCDFVNKHLMEFKPDVVHAHDWLTFEAGMLAKKNYGIPLIAHVHATEFDRSGGNGGNPVVASIEREGLLLADKVIAVSEATKDLLVRKYKIPADKIDVVYNSLDQKFIDKVYKYDDDDYKYLEEMKNDGYTIISTVGRFTIQKGLTNLMKAAARALSKNPKLIFVFAGDGEQKQELLALSAKYGISQNVVFTGFVRGKQLRDIYQVSDIFVMSSVSEPFGLTALEAAHHGNVLILTRQSGVFEVIRSAMSYDYWDTEKLADEILAIASSKGLKKILQDGIVREYRKISWPEVAKRVEKVYNEVDNHKEYS